LADDGAGFQSNFSFLSTGSASEALKRCAAAVEQSKRKQQCSQQLHTTNNLQSDLSILRQHQKQSREASKLSSAPKKVSSYLVTSVFV